MPGHCILSALHPPSQDIIQNSQMSKGAFPHILTASWTWAYWAHSLGQSVYWFKSSMALNPAWGIPHDRFVDLKLDGTMADLWVRPLIYSQYRLLQSAFCMKQLMLGCSMTLQRLSYHVLKTSSHSESIAVFDKLLHRQSNSVLKTSILDSICLSSYSTRYVVTQNKLSFG